MTKRGFWNFRSNKIKKVSEGSVINESLENIEQAEVKLRKIVNIWVAAYLNAKGFELVEYELQSPGGFHLTYLFEDTQKLDETINEYLRGGLVSAIDFMNSYKLLKGLKYDLERKNN